MSKRAEGNRQNNRGIKRGEGEIRNARGNDGEIEMSRMSEIMDGWIKSMKVTDGKPD